MSIRTIITRGYGNGTFSGAIADVVTRGYIDAAAISAAVSGSLVGSVDEDLIRDTGGTIVITLNNDTWPTAGANFNAQRQAIIDGLDAAATPATGWNNLVRDLLAVTAVVRTSDTVATITIPATPGYDIESSEVITVTVPAAALVTSSDPVIASPTISITPVVIPPVVATDKMADPGRRPHPAWIQAQKRLKREAEREAERYLVSDDALTVTGDPENYIQELAADLVLVNSDLDLIQDRVNELRTIQESDRVAVLETGSLVVKERKEAEFIQAMAKQRQTRIALWIKAIEAVVQIYYT